MELKGLGVWSLGFRVRVSGFQDFGVSGFQVFVFVVLWFWGLVFGVFGVLAFSDVGLRIWELEFNVKGWGFRD